MSLSNKHYDSHCYLATGMLYLCFINNIQDLLLVSGSSASSPPTTSVAIANGSIVMCSVWLRPVGSPGAIPVHSRTKVKSHCGRVR